MPTKHYTNPTDPDGQNHQSLESDDFDVDSLPPELLAIHLTNGGYALIDEEDLCRVDKYHWRRVPGSNHHGWYASVNVRINGKQTTFLMHRLLLGLTKEDRIKVDHKNHNGLDNRRSTNLRLATDLQNATNTRKLKEASSKYRGVCWLTREGKWQAKTAWYRGGIVKRFLLGLFDSEAEAAFAFQVAAPLLKDPEFFESEPIPPNDLPDTSRLEEIRRNTIARVKAAISGSKGNADSLSCYKGVSYNKRDKTWIVSITWNKRGARLGAYPTEDEAAYAYDCAATILKLANRPINGVKIDDRKRATEIHAGIAYRIERLLAGKKARPGASSQYRGVSFVKDSKRWICSVSCFNKMFYLGIYGTEIEAALAYNIAVSLLKVPRLIPNQIDEEGALSCETMDSIRSNVRQKLGVIPPASSAP